MSRQNRHAYLSYYKKQKCDGYSERVKYFSYDLKVHYELYFFGFFINKDSEISVDMNHKSAIMKEDKAWRFISVFFLIFVSFYLLKVVLAPYPSLHLHGFVIACLQTDMITNHDRGWN